MRRVRFSDKGSALVPVAEHQLLIKYKVTALSTACSALPRRQRRITIKMIIVPEVASHARSEEMEGVGRERKGKRDENVKETICYAIFSGPHDHTCKYIPVHTYTYARALVLIATVNANNFTRLISLSLAESARSRFQERGWTKERRKKKAVGKRTTR